MAVGLSYLTSLIHINKEISLAGSVPTVLAQTTAVVIERAAQDSYSYYSDADLQRLGSIDISNSKVLFEAMLFGNASMGYAYPTIQPTIFYFGTPYNNNTTYLEIVLKAIQAYLIQIYSKRSKSCIQSILEL